MEAAIRALAEPRRRRILELVRDGELTAGEIASTFDVSRPAVSQHLTVLKQAGLLAERREGTKRLYRARARGWRTSASSSRPSGTVGSSDSGWRRSSRKGEGAVAARQDEAVEREVLIAARPETVFEFFTDPEKQVLWMGRRAELDPRPGGIYRVEISDQIVGSGEFLEVDAPSRVVFSFGWEGQEAGAGEHGFRPDRAASR